MTRMVSFIGIAALFVACTSEQNLGDRSGGGGAGGGGEGGAGGTGGENEVTWEEFCQHKALYEMCFQRDYDLEACRRDEACFRATIRPDLFGPYLSCEAKSTCTHAENCFDLPDSQLSDAQRSYEQACRARADCDVTGDDIDWDWCDDADFAWRLVDDSLILRMTPCFDEDACSDADACLKRVVDDALAPCR